MSSKLHRNKFWMHQIKNVCNGSCEYISQTLICKLCVGNRGEHEQQQSYSNIQCHWSWIILEFKIETGMGFIWA